MDLAPLRFPDQIPIVAADGLLLRPFVAADAEVMEPLIDDPEVAAGTLTIPHPYLRGSAAPWIAGHAQSCRDHKMITWAITARADGRFLGVISLRFSPAHRRAEAGYWVARREWGNGIATAALRAVVAYAFDEVGLHRVDAHHYVENPASGAVMRKVGMRSEGVRRGAVFRDGRPRDIEEYAILRTDVRPR